MNTRWLSVPFLAALVLSTSAMAGIFGGASETQLGPDMWRVSYKGNAHVTPEKAADLALLRCAEIALNEGYGYFQIVDANARVDHSQFSTTDSYQAKIDSTGRNATISGGPKTFRYAKPTATNTILLLKNKPEGTLTYDADFLVKSLRKKYRIKDPAPKK